ncbi:hypothetical protein [Marinobacter sp. 2_MG-2023]|uniref:hypothetical protein n=1 Tax=Marinobacter sp. 2_MG-2023 TaxID=3062679 RepID=UPI0026E17D8A|nr:hypothetical protein [Marinobacter sp. 2_MG-2023]MDO6441152.1 hypothetical protein [Marinobacter sp. 2_MG-2023]
MKFEVSSNLKISPEDVDGLLTMKGVNWELSPLIYMTAPSGWSCKPIFEWPTGKVLFSSWILLFGILPIDRHTFFFSSIDRQRGFMESSSSITNKVWHHRRDIRINEALPQITDTVEFQCRLPILEYVLAPVYRLIFTHRHRVLRSYYDGSASQPVN